MSTFSEALTTLVDWDGGDTWERDAETLSEISSAIQGIVDFTERCWRFEARQSDDDLKTDLELTCIDCGEVLCDIEHRDVLATLMSVIDSHRCREDDDE